MRTVLHLLISLCCLSSILILSTCDLCEPDHKVRVCHNGKVITISIHGLKAHKAHGDALDKDHDGFFDSDNPCSEVDCDDSNPHVYPGAEGSNDCNGSLCSITNMELLNATCTDPNPTYDLQLRVTFTNPPATGTLNISIDGAVTSFPVGVSPQTVNVFSLPPTGVGVDVIANFSDQPTCQLAVDDLYNAPDCGL